jgi:hypothetical protein
LENEIDKSFENEIKTNKKNNGEFYSCPEKNIKIDDIIKIKSRFFTRSDIMSKESLYLGTNCFCKIHFKLNEYTISNVEIDNKSLLFYPKLNPRIIIRREFISNDYIVWNTLSFNNYEIKIPQKFDINLLKIDYENKN